MTILSRNSHEANRQSTPFRLKPSVFCHATGRAITSARCHRVSSQDAAKSWCAAMKGGATNEFRIPAVVGSEKKVRERVGAIAAQNGFAPGRVEDIQTAVSEAVLNAIEHGLSGRASEMVLVRCSRESDGLQVTVSNKGRPFVPSTARPDMKKKIEGNDRPRGWGLYLIRSLADDVSVDTKDDVTTVTMRFLRKSRST